MKKWLGVLMIIAGVLLGLYVGVWVLFIGGIAGIIDMITTNQITGIGVALNVVKIMFAGTIGTICAYLLIIPGIATLDSK